MLFKIISLDPVRLAGQELVHLYFIGELAKVQKVDMPCLKCPG
jgi:hypothetical protein